MKKLVLIFIIILLVSTAGLAADIKVIWNANTVDTDLVSYKVYYVAPGDSGIVLTNGVYTYSGDFLHSVLVSAPTHEYVIPDVVNGPYWVAVTAIDDLGNESLKSLVSTILVAPVEVITYPSINICPGTVTIQLQIIR